MASTNSQQGNTRTMSGLNNVNANSVNSDEIDTTTIRTTNLYTTFARGTFNFDEQLPQSTIAPVNSTDLVNKNYVDTNTGTTTLQEAYDNSVSQPQITISTTDGALIMKQEATIPEVLQVQDSTGVVKTSLRGDGEIDCVKLDATGAIEGASLMVTGAVSSGNLATGSIVCSSFTNGTVDNTELNYLNGVTSGVQAQLDAKASLSGANAFTGTNTFNTNLPTSSLTPTSDSQLATKIYVDNQLTTHSKLTNQSYDASNKETSWTFNTAYPALRNQGAFIFDPDETNMTGINVRLQNTTSGESTEAVTVTPYNNDNVVAFWAEGWSVQIVDNRTSGGAQTYGNMTFKFIVNFTGETYRTIGTVTDAGLRTFNPGQTKVLVFSSPINYTFSPASTTIGVGYNFKWKVEVSGTAPTDATFTSTIFYFAERSSFSNLTGYNFQSLCFYHQLRNFCAGVYLGNGNVGNSNMYWFPLFFSNADLANLTQTDTSAVFPAIPALGANARGSYETMYIKDSDDIFLVMPGYGVAGYDGGYSGNLRLNFLNKSNNPQTVKATSGNSLDAVKIFYMDQEVTKL
jgi:hypothetical protein